MKEIHNLVLAFDTYIDKSKIEGSLIISFDTTVTQ